MRYFESVKTVLDATLAKLCASRGVSEKQGHRLLAEHLRTMSEEWFSGNAPNIAYEDPFCRLAYLYCHVAVNANVCELAIRRTKPVLDLLQRKIDDEEELRVCAFGGGPGTELLALAKHLHKAHDPANSPLSISFTVLDRVTEWAESWRSLQRAIDGQMKAVYGKPSKRPFAVSSSFNGFDMTHVSEYAALDDYLEHDLYVMNYVVSELLEQTDKFADLVGRMVDAAASGAVFLVIDREQGEVISLTKHLLEEAGLDVINEETNCGFMDSDEQSDTLEPYVSEIGRRPRVRWRRPTTGRGVFWVVARKP